MVCYLPHILLGPLLNTLPHLLKFRNKKPDNLPFFGIAADFVVSPTITWNMLWAIRHNLKDAKNIHGGKLFLH